MFKRPAARTTDLLFYFVILMIPNGQATHDFFDLELRHHQNAEIIAIIVSYLCYRCKYITTFGLQPRKNGKKWPIDLKNYRNRLPPGYEFRSRNIKKTM